MPNIPTTIDEYIDGFPPKVIPLLRKVRRTIAQAAPEATEAIKYRLPAFVLNGNLIFFGGFTSHIGVYAMPTTNKAFKAELAPYKTGKGSVQFPYDKPIPYELIARMVQFRVKENLTKPTKNRKKG